MASNSELLLTKSAICVVLFPLNKLIPITNGPGADINTDINSVLAPDFLLFMVYPPNIDNIGRITSMAASGQVNVS